MQFRGMSRSHLFLIELIIVILFFAFSAAIAVQVLSKAHELSQSATALNGAVLAVQTAAETDKTVRLQDIDTSQRTTAYFNEDWEIAEPAGAVYIMTSDVALEEREAGTMAVYSYSVASDNKVIYQLQSKKYYSGEALSAASPDEVN